MRNDLYECPKCKYMSEEYEWNNATRKKFGALTLLPNPFQHKHIYVCPECKEEVHGSEIK